MNAFLRKLCGGVFLVLISAWSPETYAQSSLFAQEGTFRASGVRFYYKRVGTGEPVVVLHGGPGINHSYFLPQMGELARTYQLIFLDQRAHGRSSPPATRTR